MLILNQFPYTYVQMDILKIMDNNLCVFRMMFCCFNSNRAKLIYVVEVEHSMFPVENGASNVIAIL